ncbi:hypothetical protein HK102_005680, partial [Quaeritorhiza haematococci]
MGQTIEGQSLRHEVASEHLLPRDDEGILDFKRHAERVFIKDLAPKITHFSLFGRIALITGNHPVECNGVMMDRFGIRLSDSTGTCDITLWDDVFVASRLFVGQYVLLENLRTSGQKDDDSFYIMGAKDQGTQIHTVSMCRGLLASPFTRSRTYLCDALQHDQFYCRVTVCGWKFGPGENELVSPAHTICKRPVHEVRGGMMYCDFCQGYAAETEFVYTVCLVLDDGTGRLDARLLWNISQEIFGISASEFARLSLDEKKLMLDLCVGREFEILLVQVCVLRFVPRIFFKLTRSLMYAFSLQEESGSFRADAATSVSSPSHSICCLIDSLQAELHQIELPALSITSVACVDDVMSNPVAHPRYSPAIQPTSAKRSKFGRSLSDQQLVRTSHEPESVVNRKQHPTPVDPHPRDKVENARPRTLTRAHTYDNIISTQKRSTPTHQQPPRQTNVPSRTWQESKHVVNQPAPTKMTAAQPRNTRPTGPSTSTSTSNASQKPLQQAKLQFFTRPPTQQPSQQQTHSKPFHQQAHKNQQARKTTPELLNGTNTNFHHKGANNS